MQDFSHRPATPSLESPLGHFGVGNVRSIDERHHVVDIYTPVLVLTASQLFPLSHDNGKHEYVDHCSHRCTRRTDTLVTAATARKQQEQLLERRIAALATTLETDPPNERGRTQLKLAAAQDELAALRAQVVDGINQPTSGGGQTEAGGTHTTSEKGKQPVSGLLWR